MWRGGGEKGGEKETKKGTREANKEQQSNKATMSKKQGITQSTQVPLLTARRQPNPN